MEEFLTTRQVQDLLKVDRITIYRMLQDGRLKGVKIGQQWRFPQREVDQLLNRVVPEPAPAVSEVDNSFPTHCVQTIQDLFSSVSQMGAFIVDQRGEPLTEISGSCAFCRVLMSTPAGQEACRACWKDFVRSSAEGNKFFTCHSGLQYIGAPLTDRGEQVGLFLVGPFYWQPPHPREQDERVGRLAAAYGISAGELQQAAREIAVVAPEQHAQLEAWPFAAARAVQSILAERSGFMERLRKIANLTQLK
ncbi:MAG TPA: PocR ligand-binding domain-containing protein [Anaerolineaceae bacterium]